MNKLNKLVNATFDSQASFLESWNSEDFQKKLKKVFKNKREKLDKPKQHTPYIQFCMAERPLIKQEHPDMSAKDITAKLGEKWNQYKTEKPEYLEKNYGYKSN